MGYFKNLEIGEQVINKTTLLTTLIVVWAQLLVTAGLLVWVATK
jgi:hypothetical protein